MDINTSKSEDQILSKVDQILSEEQASADEDQAHLEEGDSGGGRPPFWLKLMRALICFGISCVVIVLCFSFWLFAKGKAYDESTRLKNFYPEGAGIRTDGEFKEYCLKNIPEAFIKHPPTEMDDADVVIKSFSNGELPWVIIELDTGISYSGQHVAMLWARDGLFWDCFILVSDGYGLDNDSHRLDSGWLYKNGMRIKAYDEVTYENLSPQVVLSLYRTGEWDGQGILRSSDYGTTVSIAGDGSLAYRYSESLLTHELVSALSNRPADDAEDLYQGYQDPWWWSASEAEQAHIVQVAMAGDYNELGADENDARGGFHESLKSGIPNELGGNLCQTCSTDYLVDVPEEFQKTIYAQKYVGSWRSKEVSGGTYLLVQDGVLQYKTGNLVRQWRFDWDYPDDVAEIPYDRKPYFTFSYSDDEAPFYVCTGQQVVRLYADGSTEVIIDQIVSKVTNEFDDVFGIKYTNSSASSDGKSGNLVAWNRYSDEPYLIEENVLKASFREGPRIFEKADGCYVFIPEKYCSSIEFGDHEIKYLGNRSLEEYISDYGLLAESADWY